MKIKRIKSLKVNCHTFKVIWDKTQFGASFNYGKCEIIIGTKDPDQNYILMLICHELMEICASEMSVRLHRPDCDSDYIFVYDHRQHETMMFMFSGLLEKFLE